MKREKRSYHTYEEDMDDALDRHTNNQIEVLQENQKATLIKFVNHLILQSLSKSTILSYTRRISILLRYNKKTIEELSKEDIETFLLSLKDLNQTSKFAYFISIKMLLRWLKKEEYMEGIRLKRCLHIKLPEEILTLEEIKRMVEIATNFRDKALLFTLYETGARKGELLKLRVKHVTFDKNGALITLPKGKTVPRQIRIIQSVPELRNWLNVHPAKDNPESPLWINTVTYTKRALAQSGLRLLIKSVAKRAGIKKTVYPHLFRHSRLTELARLGLNEVALRIFAGWSGDSTMPKVYIHLSGADVENKLLEIYGVTDKEKDEKSKNVLKPIICWRCQEENGATTRFCGRCGADLDQEKRSKERRIVFQQAENIDDIKNFEELKTFIKQLIQNGNLPEE